MHEAIKLSKLFGWQTANATTGGSYREKALSIKKTPMASAACVRWQKELGGVMAGKMVYPNISIIILFTLPVHKLGLRR